MALSLSKRKQTSKERSILLLFSILKDIEKDEKKFSRNFSKKIMEMLFLDKKEDLTKNKVREKDSLHRVQGYAIFKLRRDANCHPI